MSKDIVDLFKKTGGNIGLDDDSSSIIIQNLNASTMPMCTGSPFTADEEDTDEFKILFFAFDGSGSMSSVQSELIQEFNQTIIPGLKEGAKNVIAGIRVGGLIFGSQVHPLWGAGFKPLAELPPLTARDYQAGGATCLYRGTLDALVACAGYALELRQKTGSNPEVILVILSDGANNQPPTDPDEVYRVASKLSPELFTLAFAGFETCEQVDFTQIARAMGFPNIFEMKQQPGETPEDRRRRFRHMLGVMSSSLVGQIGKAPAQTANAGGFWQQP